MTLVFVLVGILVVLAILGAGSSVKIIREYQRVILFRLGRSIGAKGPGLTFVNPITDRVSWVDLREQFLEIPHQTAITRDNAPISIDFIIFYKVFDPVMSVLQVKDFSGAALNIAATTLRSVVGDMSLDDVLSKREAMNDTLRVKLDEVTERWGVKITNVEVREINPPPAVQEAMTRQMSAERTRRAVVTESEGQKQAQITVAEGQKQAAILSAEGQREAVILAAEAERQAQSLRSEGAASALGRVSAIAKDIDPNTVFLQYLDALRQVASSPSSKIVLPLELTNMLSGLTNLAGRAGLSATTTRPATLTQPAVAAAAQEPVDHDATGSPPSDATGGGGTTGPGRPAPPDPRALAPAASEVLLEDPLAAAQVGAELARANLEAATNGVVPEPPGSGTDGG